MALTVTPGIQLAAGEKATRVKLNLLGQPVVEIGDNTITEAQLSNALRALIEPPRNYFINPDFEIWPLSDWEGAAYSHSLVVVGSRKHDYAGVARWVTPNVNATRVLTREAFPAGQITVPDHPLYFLRYVQSAALSGINPGYVGQRIEDVKQLASNTVTFSIWVRASAALTLTPQCRQVFGPANPPSAVDYPAAVLTAGDPVTLVGEVWTKIEQTFDVPSVAGKLIAPTISTGADAAVGSFTEFRLLLPQGVVFQIDLAHAMLNLGSAASLWERRSRTQEEYLIERYFQVVYAKPATSLTAFKPFINARQFMPFLQVGWTGGGIVAGANYGGGLGAVYALTSVPSQLIYQSVAHANSTDFISIFLNGELHYTD